MGKKVTNFHPLSNSEIDRTLIKLLGREYKGSYARDNLPDILKTGYYVMNLDDLGNEGTHWVGMKVNQKEIIYFDSFGFICPNEVVHRKGSRKILYSSHEIQNTKSVACGYYVIYFLNELFKGRNKVDVLLDFQNNGSLTNDQRLQNLISE